MRKPAISLADSTDLRVLLNIMYLIVETVQQDDSADRPEWRAIRDTFQAELGKPPVCVCSDYLCTEGLQEDFLNLCLLAAPCFP